MIVSIFDKYSVVPKTAVSESSNNSGSRDLNNYLNKKLRKDATILRSLIEKGASTGEVQKSKETILQEVCNFLTISSETPPETFNFEYRGKEKDYRLDQNLASQTFFEKYVGVSLHDYVNIINAPTGDKPFNRTYTAEVLGNIVGGKEVKYLNVEVVAFRRLAAAQLEQDESVWFDCDVEQFSTRDIGVMALDVYDMNDLLGVNFTMTKAERLDFGESLMIHTMVLTGVDIVDGQTTRWKVENSWGEKIGENGFFVMNGVWMNEYTYQIVVHKDLLTDEQKKAWEQAPTVLASWDPVGALA